MSHKKLSPQSNDSRIRKDRLSTLDGALLLPRTDQPDQSDRGEGVGASLPLRITEVRLRFPPDQAGSVVAYASCLINGFLALNDIRIEHGRSGGLVVVYPSRPSSTGKRHHTFYPVTREAGEAFRVALLAGVAAIARGAES